MTEPVNNQWLDEILIDFDTWCLCRADECVLVQNFKQAKQAILSKLESIEKEARIDMLETFIKYEENQPGYIDWDFLANQISSLRGD